MLHCTHTSLSGFVVLAYLWICRPDNDLVEVETHRRDISDKWLFTIFCEICWIKCYIINLLQEYGLNKAFSLDFVAPVKTNINATAFCRSPTGFHHRAVHKLAASRRWRSAAAGSRQGMWNWKGGTSLWEQTKTKSEKYPHQWWTSKDPFYVTMQFLHFRHIHLIESVATFIPYYVIL